MGLILDISPRTLERVLYFASYIVLDKGETDLLPTSRFFQSRVSRKQKKNGKTCIPCRYGC